MVDIYKEIEESIKKWSESSSDESHVFFNKLREIVHKVSKNPNSVGCIRFIPVEKVSANDYNPNSVAKQEMKLLHTSISHDSYTQPVVTIFDDKQDQYVIIDGFHRYLTMKNNQDVYDTLGMGKGLLPVVVLTKNINDRMASTVRHNRARGKHSINGMSSMVFSMLDNGWKDADICEELGMEADELVRLKHITGFSKLFESVEYKKAWETKRQIQLRKEYEKKEQETGKEDSIR